MLKLQVCSSYNFFYKILTIITLCLSEKNLVTSLQRKNRTSVWLKERVKMSCRTLPMNFLDMSHSREKGFQCRLWEEKRQRNVCRSKFSHLKLYFMELTKLNLVWTQPLIIRCHRAHKMDKSLPLNRARRVYNVFNNFFSIHRWWFKQANAFNTNSR